MFSELCSGWLGTEKDHARFLAQSAPSYSPAEMARKMSLRAARAQTQCAARYLERYIDLNGGSANLRLANLWFDCKEIYNRSGLTPILQASPYLSRGKRESKILRGIKLDFANKSLRDASKQNLAERMDASKLKT
jgi:hypothetical protein